MQNQIETTHALVMRIRFASEIDQTKEYILATKWEIVTDYYSKRRELSAFAMNMAFDKELFTT
jgi:hypothetical protein